jgi:hypothetical protein
VGEGIKNVQPKPWRVQLGEMLLERKRLVDVLELTGTKRRGRELVLQGNLPIKFPDQRSCRARISEQARTASGQWTDGRALRQSGCENSKLSGSCSPFPLSPEATEKGPCQAT